MELRGTFKPLLLGLRLVQEGLVKEMCDQGFVGAARFCAKWGIKLVQATLIPLARSYFPLNCEQADQQIFGSSVKSGLIIGHRNTSPFRVYFPIYFVSYFLAFQINNNR